MQKPSGFQYPDVFKEEEAAGPFRGVFGPTFRRHADDDSDICLDLTKGAKRHCIRKAVLKGASRIRFLKLGRETPTVFRELYDSSSAFATHFTRLEGLSVAVPSQYAEAAGALSSRGHALPPLRLRGLLQCLATIDSLRQLHLDFGLYDRANITATLHYQALFKKLTHIHIRGSTSVRELLLLLPHCTDAVEINVDTHGFLEHELDDPVAPRRIRLPSLRWFQIAANEFVEAILRRLDCPVLENLFIMNGTPPQPFQIGEAIRRVCPYKTYPIAFWDTIRAFLASCVHLRQLVLAVHCSWGNIIKHSFILEGVESIQEVDFQVMDPEKRDCTEAIKVGHWFSMVGCSSHDGYISHVGRTATEGVHIGTPLRPVDWRLGFWHTEDSLKDPAFSSSWKGSPQAPV